MLEMLVVLLLIGLLTAMAMPGLQRMSGSINRALQRDQLGTLIDRLAVDVREAGRPVLLTRAPDEGGGLPAAFLDELIRLDAKIEAEKPIFISAAGFCPFGGVVQLSLSGRTHTGRLESPQCRLQW